MLQGYKSVLLGEYEDDSVFAHIFEPDLDDEDAETTWLKCIRIWVLPFRWSSTGRSTKRGT